MGTNKKRVTIPLRDPDLEFAESYAAQHDVPLSRVIEIALWRLRENPKKPLFGEKWLGRLKVRKRPGDPRYEHLARKYK
jgi:hypothetical protein